MQWLTWKILTMLIIGLMALGGGGYYFYQHHQTPTGVPSDFVLLVNDKPVRCQLKLQGLYSPPAENCTFGIVTLLKIPESLKQTQKTKDIQISVFYDAFHERCEPQVNWSELVAGTKICGMSMKVSKIIKQGN